MTRDSDIHFFPESQCIAQSEIADLAIDPGDVLQ
jgi:hypothetical protein